MRQALALFLLLSLTAGPAHAVVAKYADEFLSYGPGARPLALGGAYAGAATDVLAAYWNPAGLAVSSGRQLAAMHAERFGGVVAFDYLGYSFKVNERSALAISVLRLGVDQIPDTRNLEIADWGTDGLSDRDEPNYHPDSNPDPGGDNFSDNNPSGTEGNSRLDPGERVYYDEGRLIWLSDAETALFLSFATGTDKLAWGVNLKLFRKAVGQYAGNGLGIDLAVLYRPRAYLSLGANLQDAASSILVWGNGTRETILPHLKVGLGLKPKLPLVGNSLHFLFDLDLHGGNRRTADRLSIGRFSANEHLGIEYWVGRRFALRWGEFEGAVTAGAGLLLGPAAIDYAFGDHPHLGDSHRISGLLRF